VGGIPPAEPSQFRSDIFKQTPPKFGIQIPAKNMVGAKRRLFCLPPKNSESERVFHAPRGSKSTIRSKLLKFEPTFLNK